MKEDAETRRKLAQQGRLWLLSVICAAAGAITISETGSLTRGIGVFLICVAVLGAVLFVFERRRRPPQKSAQRK